MRRALLPLALLLAMGLHAATYRASEPWYNGDEPRHVMTGVFFHDLLLDGAWSHPIRYATDYYLQYPALALGIYPPLYHLVEGMVMLPLGSSMSIAKGLIVLFALLAGVYLFAIARRKRGPEASALACLLLLLAPAVFKLSSYVMLEVPTLAWSLMFLFHLDRYFELGRRRDLGLAAAAAAATALTRFSGYYLLPTVAILLVLRAERRRRMASPEAIVAVLLVVAVIAPYYALAAQWIGGLHFQQAMGGSSTPESSFSFPRSLLDYPASLPKQIGWPLAIAGVVGLLLGIARRDRSADIPMALIAGVYVAFTPLAMRDPRFTIYWIPGFALLAADVVVAVGRRAGRVAAGGLAMLLIAATATAAWLEPRPILRGYEAAARFVADHTKRSRYCLFDGTLNGNFIYQIRRADPGRRIQVLRGDRILYSVSIVPELGYADPLTSPDSMLAEIHRYDPDWIVVEDPPVFFRTPAGDRLRGVLRGAHNQYRLAAEFPITGDVPQARGVKLLAYESLVRNPAPAPRIEIRLPALRRTLRE
jgi:hypothetical protein